MTRAVIEAESAVLSSLLHRPSAIASVGLSPDDFLNRKHREIFAALLELDTVTDVVTLTAKLPELADEIIGIASNSWTSAQLPNHASIVRQAALGRRMSDVLDEAIRGMADNDRPIVDILDATIGGLMNLNSRNTKYDHDFVDAVRGAWEAVDHAYQHKGQLVGITTGFERLDARFGGFHKGDLTLIGARPSMGKTAIMANMAMSAYAAGHNIGIISGEQPKEQIAARAMSLGSNVPAESLRNGNVEEEHWGYLMKWIGSVKRDRIRILDRAEPELDEIIRTARKWKHEYGIKALYVDYLQRIRYRKGQVSRIDEVSEVARGMKTLARELDIPVICLAQVKATVDNRDKDDRRPRLGDIANSDEATREADQIMFLYRDEVYFPETTTMRGIAELNVEKNRHGPTGQFKLAFIAETMRFGNLAGGPY
jgi:replicative DNA helicase